MKVVVTGGAGFIGSALIRHILQHSDFHVINIDKLTYAGNLQTIQEVSNKKSYKFFQIDITEQKKVEQVLLEEKPDLLMHLAAESHVDRSIDNPFDFIKTNILGTFSLLEASKNYLSNLNKIERNSFCFHHISTDEVFGSLEGTNRFSEESNYSPNSPYAASKASSDHLVRSWGKTYDIPYLITNCSNNFGPFQYPEKLIPTTIINAINKKNINIYGQGNNIRDWLYVEDHASALWKIVNSSLRNDTFCIGADNEKTNLEVVSLICHVLKDYKESKTMTSFDYSSLINFVDDRPGHDLRYSIDASKFKREFNWKPKESFESCIKKTVYWYIENQKWCEEVLKGDTTQTRRGLNI